MMNIRLAENINGGDTPVGVNPLEYSRFQLVAPIHFYITLTIKRGKENE